MWARCALVIILLISTHCLHAADLPENLPENPADAFAELASSLGLEVSAPDGFVIAEPRQDVLLAYEHAYDHNELPISLRYSVRPLNWIEIDYSDPHSSAPEPNHLFPMLFQTLISDLSQGLRTAHREYSAEESQHNFGADWAAMAAIDLAPENRTPHSQMVLLALHKNNVADVYLAIAYDEFDGLKQEIRAAVSHIRFR